MEHELVGQKNNTQHYLQRCQPKKKSKSGRSPILPSLTPKVAPSRDLPIKSQKRTKYPKRFPQSAKKSAKICLKIIVFHALLFLLSGRFCDQYRRVGDLVCIQESWQRCTYTTHEAGV